MSYCATSIQIPGVAGTSAFAFVTANFTLPTIGSNVVIQLTTSVPFVPGQNIIIAGPANFQIVTVDNPNQITAQFLGLDGDLSAADVISLGAQVSPAGRPGAAGAAGQNGFAITTSDFSVPSIGSTVVVPVDDNAAFVVGSYAVATGPANFVVAALTGTTSITLKFLGNTGDVSPGATIASGSTIAPTGSAGPAAFTSLTAQITIPAKNATVTAAVLSTAQMAEGQYVFISANGGGGNGGTFEVTTINSSTSVTLTFLQNFGDLAPANTLANGSIVTPTGKPASAGNTVSTTLASPFVIPVTTPTDIGISLTLPETGTYNLSVFLNTLFSSDYNGYNGENPVTLTIYRSNNTPTDLGSITLYPITGTNPSAGSRVTWGVFPIRISSLSATAGDQIGIKASYANALGGGTISIETVSMVADQIG